MPNGNNHGFIKPPPAGTVQGQTQMIACPFHTIDPVWDEHPGGSPDCVTIPENIAMGRVIPLGHLVSWVARMLGEIGPLVNVLWLHHLVVHGTAEAKGQAEEALTRMGEIDAGDDFDGDRDAGEAGEETTPAREGPEAESSA